MDIALSILIIILVIYFIISWIIYYKLFVVDKNADYHVVNQEDPFFNPSYLWFQKAPKDEVQIKAYDGAILKGYFLPSLEEDSNNLAIIVHGYHACSDDMIIIAKLYSDLGFKVLLINQRGHHLSEGDSITFGQYEKQDLKRWIHYALRTYSATDQILLHGVSMGASTIMLTLGDDIPENIKYAVLDSGYSSLSGLFREMARPKIVRIFFPGVSLITYYRHKFFIRKVSPIQAMKKSKVPFVIIHSEDDEQVPFKMGKEIFDASLAPYKDFYPVKGCPHGEGYIIDKLGIENFLKITLPKYFTIKKKYQK